MEHTIPTTHLLLLQRILEVLYRQLDPEATFVIEKETEEELPE